MQWKFTEIKYVYVQIRSYRLSCTLTVYNAVYITVILNPSPISSPCKEAAALVAAAVDRSSTGNVGRRFARSFDLLFVCLSR